MSSEEKKTSPLIYAAVAIVITVVAWGFALIGSPSFNRKLSSDRNRVTDLQGLRRDIDRYFEEQKKLPEKLSDLDKLSHQYGYQRNIDDTSTKKPYDYTPVDAYNYELCADFELSSQDAELEQGRYDFYEKLWEHPAGHQCFKFDIPEGKRAGKPD